MDSNEALFLENQILGCLYGNCIGDAIGLLTEFMTKEEAKKNYGRGNLMLEYDHKVSDKHRDCWVNGDWTDDSDQMILIMDSIINCTKQTKANKVDVVDFAGRLNVWASHGFPELGDRCGFGLGHTTHLVLNHKQFLSKPHHAAKDAWERSGRFAAPNGAVMRTSILGIYNYKDLKSVQENCKAIAKVTHADPRCVASCVAVCSAIVFMLQKQKQHLTKDGYLDLQKIIQDSYREAVAVFEEDVENNSKELWSYMSAETVESLKLDEPGKIGYTYKSLGAGFWALKHRDFRSALTSVTMEAGDADTNGAVAGALLGCKVGYQHLPDTWLDGLIHKQWLNNKIYSFMKVSMPQLEMKLIHYDKNHTPQTVLTPKQARRKEQEMRKNAEETQVNAVQKEQHKQVNSSDDQEAISINPAAKHGRDHPSNTEFRNHEAGANRENYRAGQQRSDHTPGTEKPSRDHVQGVQHRDDAHGTKDYGTQDLKGAKGREHPHGAMQQSKDHAHSQLQQSTDGAHGQQQKGKGNSHGSVQQSKDRVHGQLHQTRDGAHGPVQQSKGNSHSSMQQSKDRAHGQMQQTRDGAHGKTHQDGDDPQEPKSQSHTASEQSRYNVL